MNKAWIYGLIGVLASALSLGAAAAQEDQAGWTDKVPKTPGAKQLYVAADGKADNNGAKDSPWDLRSVLDGKQKVAPGDIVWLRGGTYTMGTRGEVVKTELSGTKAAPIIFRGVPGERATLFECGIEPLGQHTWFWDIEFRGEAIQTSAQTGSFPEDILRYGPFNVRAPNTKAIGLIVHTSPGGLGGSIHAAGSEYHGCIVFNNGWIAPDRWHGHCMYAQVKDDSQTVGSCILAVPEGGYTMHAYGSWETPIQNFTVEDTASYGPATFLVGGEAPSANINILRNYLYKTGMQIGYTAPSDDCIVKDNVVVGGLMIRHFKKVTDEGNLRAGAETPALKTVVIPNKYDSKRAHVVVFNGKKAAEVSVDASAFLKNGEAYRLMSPFDFYGQPIAEGTCQNGQITVPMQGAHAKNGEFAAVVLLK